jgi:hypothetical protein
MMFNDDVGSDDVNLCIHSLFGAKKGSRGNLPTIQIVFLHAKAEKDAIHNALFGRAL